MDGIKKKGLSRRNFIKGAVAGVALAGLAPAVARKANAETPSIKLAFILSDHHAPLMVLARNWELFQQKYNICLKPVTEDKLYDFMYEGSRIARVQIIPTAKGPDIERLVAQGSVDVGISGTQAIILSVDRGIDTRIVSPLQTAGNMFVLKRDLGMNTWDEFVRQTKGGGKQFKIGTPGPDTVAAIIFRSALENQGITSSEDATNKNADVLFMNMKGHGNLVAALSNGITEGIIGAQPFPAVTVKNGTGTIILNLQDVPPAGKWKGHACCSVGATGDFIARDRDLVVKTMELIALGVGEANADRAMTARTCSSWLGVEEDVEQSALTTHNYTIIPSERWIESVYTYVETMDEMKLFNGKLVGKRSKELDPLVFDFRYMEEARKNLKQKKFIA
jgi:NitT/TauT family transport system substrate-binding protein